MHIQKEVTIGSIHVALPFVTTTILADMVSIRQSFRDVASRGSFLTSDRSKFYNLTASALTASAFTASDRKVYNALVQADTLSLDRPVAASEYPALAKVLPFDDEATLHSLRAAAEAGDFGFGEAGAGAGVEPVVGVEAGPVAEGQARAVFMDKDVGLPVAFNNFEQSALGRAGVEDDATNLVAKIAENLAAGRNFAPESPKSSKILTNSGQSFTDCSKILNITLQSLLECWNPQPVRYGTASVGDVLVETYPLTDYIKDIRADLLTLDDTDELALTALENLSKALDGLNIRPCVLDNNYLTVITNWRDHQVALLK